MLSGGETGKIAAVAVETVKGASPVTEDSTSQGSWVVSAGVGNGESRYMDLTRVGYRFGDTWPVEASASVRMSKGGSGFALAFAQFPVKSQNVWMGYGAEAFLMNRNGGDLSALTYVRFSATPNGDAALILGGGAGYNNIERSGFLVANIRFEVVLP